MATAKKKPKKFDWCKTLNKTFTERFGLQYELTTTWNVVLGACVTKRADGKPLSKLQRVYLDGFMDRHGATE